MKRDCCRNIENYSLTLELDLLPSPSHQLQGYGSSRSQSATFISYLWIFVYIIVRRFDCRERRTPPPLAPTESVRCFGVAPLRAQAHIAARFGCIHRLRLGETLNDTPFRCFTCRHVECGVVCRALQRDRLSHVPCGQFSICKYRIRGVNRGLFFLYKVRSPTQHSLKPASLFRRQFYEKWYKPHF